MTTPPTKLLPSRPWTLATGFKLRRAIGGIIMLLVGAGAGFGYSYWQIGELRQIATDEAIWHMPDAGKSGADVKGNVSSRFIFHTYTLDVTYDVGEKEETHKVEFGTLSEIDREKRAEVRFDPKNPSHFALSWAVDASGSRWASGITMLILGDLLVAGSFLFLGATVLIKLRAALRVQQNGVELYAAVVSVTEQSVNGKPNGQMAYRLRLPSTAEDPDSPFAQPVEVTIMHPKKSGAPAHTTAGTIVLLDRTTSPTKPEALLLAANDLYPLTLSSDDKQRVIAALAQA